MDLRLVELVSKIQSGEVTPLESISQCFERVHSLNPLLNCFITIRESEAIEEAKQQTEKMKRGEKVGLLAGIPLAVKDLEDVKGVATTYGTHWFLNNVRDESSVQVERLTSQGAIVGLFSLLK